MKERDGQKSLVDSVSECDIDKRETIAISVDDKKKPNDVRSFGGGRSICATGDEQCEGPCRCGRSVQMSQILADPPLFLTRPCCAQRDIRQKVGRARTDLRGTRIRYLGHLIFCA